MVELHSLQVAEGVVVVVAAGSHSPQLLAAAESARAAEIRENRVTNVVLDPRKSDWEGMMFVWL